MRINPRTQFCRNGCERQGQTIALYRRNALGSAGTVFDSREMSKPSLSSRPGRCLTYARRSWFGGGGIDTAQRREHKPRHPPAFCAALADLGLAAWILARCTPHQLPRHVQPAEVRALMSDLRRGGQTRWGDDAVLAALNTVVRVFGDGSEELVRRAVPPAQADNNVRLQDSVVNQAAPMDVIKSNAKLCAPIVLIPVRMPPSPLISRHPRARLPVSVYATPTLNLICPCSKPERMCVSIMIWPDQYHIGGTHFHTVCPYKSRTRLNFLANCRKTSTLLSPLFLTVRKHPSPPTPMFCDNLRRVNKREDFEMPIW